MIVHSSQNVAGGCLVQVEGIDTATPQAVVELFAQGAAGKHNAGYVVGRSTVQWLDDNLKPMPPEADTSQSTAAHVMCEVSKP